MVGVQLRGGDLSEADTRGGVLDGVDLADTSVRATKANISRMSQLILSTLGAYAPKSVSLVTFACSTVGMSRLFSSSK
jgi:uncharacterized protein YjbI with pentapeptide repeats